MGTNACPWSCLGHHHTCVHGHFGFTNACPWSCLDHHHTCVQGHFGFPNACPWSCLGHHHTCVQGHFGFTNACPCSCRDHHLTCVQGHLGSPCVRTECLAPPNPACSHVLDPHDCPECDGLCVPDWWKPRLQPPGRWMSPPAPCHHRLLYNQASGGRPTFQLGLKGSAAQCQGPVCAPHHLTFPSDQVILQFSALKKLLIPDRKTVSKTRSLCVNCSLYAKYISFLVQETLFVL